MAQMEQHRRLRPRRVVGVADCTRKHLVAPRRLHRRGARQVRLPRPSHAGRCAVNERIVDRLPGAGGIINQGDHANIDADTTCRSLSKTGRRFSPRWARPSARSSSRCSTVSPCSSTRIGASTTHWSVLPGQLGRVPSRAVPARQRPLGAITRWPSAGVTGAGCSQGSAGGLLYTSEPHRQVWVSGPALGSMPHCEAHSGDRITPPRVGSLVGYAGPTGRPRFGIYLSAYRDVAAWWLQGRQHPYRSVRLPPYEVAVNAPPAEFRAVLEDLALGAAR